MLSVDVWKTFDAIFVITLEDEKDRHEYVAECMNDLCIPFEFYKAKRSPLGGRYGCFESHVQVCRIAHERKYRNIVIFEDDVLPTTSYNLAAIQDIADFINEDVHWERIQMGYACVSHVSDLISGPIRFMCSERVNRGLVRYHGVNMHAVCLSHIAIRKIVAAAPTELAKQRNITPYDLWLSHDCLDTHHQYCTIPLLFDQKWSFASSIQKRPLSWLREEFALFHKLSFLRAQRTESVVVLVATLVMLVFLWMCIRRIARIRKKC